LQDIFGADSSETERLVITLVRQIALGVYAFLLFGFSVVLVKWSKKSQTFKDIFQ